MTGKPPPKLQRVRVSSPRLAAGPRPPARPVTSEIDEGTEVGELYVTALLRAQLRPGLLVLGVVTAALGALPLLFLLVPGLAEVRLGPLPLPWLLLGVAVYPLLVAAGWWHVRAAERVERDAARILGGR